jgi:TPR repeat protein
VPSTRALAVVTWLLCVAGPAQAGWQQALLAWRNGDHAAALQAWQALAETGDDTARYNSAVLMLEEPGLTRDPHQAVDLLQRAAAHNNDARFCLGYLYATGILVAQDEHRAVYWYRKAADAGLAAARFNLALLYRARGDGEAAAALLRAAAGQGLAQAQFLQAQDLVQDPSDKDSMAQAVTLYRQAAGQGYAPAQRMLGVALLEGAGVDADSAQAVQWLTRAAGQDDPVAEYYLGMLYRTGRGVEKQPDQAARWLLAAARQGNASARYNLGLLYRDGIGVEQSDQEAVRWYRAAAEQGDARAQNNLGSAYVNGRGVPQDLVLAHMWFNLAAANGNENGGRNRDVLAARLDANQLAEAQRLARDWFAAHAAPPASVQTAAGGPAPAVAAGGVPGHLSPAGEDGAP